MVERLEYDEGVSEVSHVPHKHLYSPADGDAPLRRAFPARQEFYTGRASSLRRALGAFQTYVSCSPCTAALHFHLVSHVSISDEYGLLWLEINV